MQIVIDVPQYLVYEGFERPFTEEEKNFLIKAIGNGTPLPGGHGRLIDADKLMTLAHEEGAYDYVSAKEIADAPTIIESILWGGN